MCKKFDQNWSTLAKTASGFSYYYYRSEMEPHNAPNAELREFL
jgi:hypothetical protein